MCGPIAALAQTAPAPAPADERAVVEADIIVTARRSDERLQDVPVSVQVVTGDKLSQLAITSADELSKLAPGLTLVNDAASTQVSLRGVSWRPGSGTPATPIYFNEVPFDPGNTVVSLFDIGQIEVLRGPQGTSRGAPSISGAVTIATKKPNLTEFGGYVQGFYASANHLDLQAAINVPIIKDILAIRLATNIENSEANRVYSVNSTIKPSIKDRSFRGTVLFTPTDTVSILGMYQRRTTDKLFYNQVVGTGSPGAAASPVAFLGALGAIPANFNGPALTIGQRASVQDAPSIFKEKIDLLTVNASWEVFGQKLSYNFGRQFNRGPATFTTSDPLNMIPGFESYTSPSNIGLPEFSTHEIRLSSMPDADRPFDYDIGWFSKHSQGTLNFNAPVYLAGAFGGPTSLPGAVRTPNPAYVLNSSTNIGIGQVFDSFYGDVKFHLSPKTELTGGLAIVRDRVPVSLAITTFPALNNIGNLNVVRLGFPAAYQPLVTSCAVVGAFSGANIVASTAYPGTCDAVVPAGVGNATQNNNDKYTAALYNFSLSHKFTDDILAYATTGSSFRTGLPAISNPGLPTNLVTPAPETAKSYEVGIKTSWGRRLQVNASVFQLDYKNQLTTFEGVQYFNTVSSRVALTSLAFYRNVDSQVRGFELEINAQPIRNLTLNATLAYSQIKSKGALVPSNPGDCAGAAAVTAANPINFCPSVAGQVLNQDAPFSATTSGNYNIPLTNALDGYLRFNVAYKGNNPNYGNFRQAGAFRSTPAYAIVDLYAGLTGGHSAWSLGVYAKNVFDKQAELARVTPVNNVYGPYAIAPAGYDQVRTTLPRELGVTLRYAFGSK
ncbi:TonB-dependent receptor [Sphingomonas psychrolutea]|uniref:TonB-dependent receptor n=1 Tax=Sphingomonas psychrolutea TaxID=1259676 RepID=A0ABQ1G4K5_9SPHN|nr:TonB-dependent receptor [Sphingomonas psychrolutea]